MGYLAKLYALRNRGQAYVVAGDFPAGQSSLDL